MGKSSQRKGADGERELAKELREYRYDIERGGSLTFGTVPDLSGLPGVQIECKRVERLNVPATMKQPTEEAEKFADGMPSLFHRRNRQAWLVTLRFDDFMQLYQNSRSRKSGRSSSGSIHGLRYVVFHASAIF